MKKSFKYQEIFLNDDKKVDYEKLSSFQGEIEKIKNKEKVLLFQMLAKKNQFYFV